MSRNVLVMLGLIVGIGLVSGILAYLRTASLSTPDEIAAKGLVAIRRDRVSFYSIFMPILVGVIAFFVYRFLNGRAPETAATTLMIIALGIAVVFEVLAGIVFKMRGFAELTFLHVVYVVGFGWLLPKLVIP